MPENQSGKKSLEELVMTQSYILEAIMNLLEKKNLISREEIVQELKLIQAAVFEKIQTEKS